MLNSAPQSLPDRCIKVKGKISDRNDMPTAPNTAQAGEKTLIVERVKEL